MFSFSLVGYDAKDPRTRGDPREPPCDRDKRRSFKIRSAPRGHPREGTSIPAFCGGKLKTQRCCSRGVEVPGCKTWRSGQIHRHYLRRNCGSPASFVTQDAEYIYKRRVGDGSGGRGGGADTRERRSETLFDVRARVGTTRRSRVSPHLFTRSRYGRAAVLSRQTFHISTASPTISLTRHIYISASLDHTKTPSTIHRSFLNHSTSSPNLSLYVTRDVLPPSSLPPSPPTSGEREEWISVAGYYSSTGDYYDRVIATGPFFSPTNA